MSDLSDLANYYYGVSKADDERTRHRKNVAIGAGSGAAALGLVGGGVPGMKSDRIPIDIENAKGAKNKVKMAARVGRGGIFGARDNMHSTAMGFSPKMNPDSFSGKSRYQKFRNSGIHGLRHAEDRVIGHLRVGKKGSNALLLGGAGAVAYGASRRRKVEKASREDYRSRAVGLGAGAAVGGAGVGTLLSHQGNNWLHEAKRDLDAAQRLTPKAGGATVTRTRRGKLKTVRATTKMKDITPEMLEGVSLDDAKKAGRLRGAAGQAGYFGHQYKINAKVLRRGVAPAGLGLAAWGAAGKKRQQR